MDLLKQFKMDDCKASATPYQSGVKLMKDCESSQVDTPLYHQLVNTLIYLSHSQPDISFVVSVVSHFTQNHRESNWKDAKCIVLYLKSTSHFGIKYSWITNSLIDYTNSEWDGDDDDRKSTSNFVFCFSY